MSPPSSPSPTAPLLTLETVASHVCSKLDKLSSVFPSSTTSEVLVSRTVEGGNLNYTFSVQYVNSSTSVVFVKQAPPYVRCLGVSTPLHKERIELEVKAFEVWLEASPEVER